MRRPSRSCKRRSGSRSMLRSSSIGSPGSTSPSTSAWVEHCPPRASPGATPTVTWAIPGSPTALWSFDLASSSLLRAPTTQCRGSRLRGTDHRRRADPLGSPRHRPRSRIAHHGGTARHRWNVWPSADLRGRAGSRAAPQPRHRPSSLAASDGRTCPLAAPVRPAARATRLVRPVSNHHRRDRDNRPPRVAPGPRDSASTIQIRP